MNVYFQCMFPINYLDKFDNYKEKNCSMKKLPEIYTMNSSVT